MASILASSRSCALTGSRLGGGTPSSVSFMSHGAARCFGRACCACESRSIEQKNSRTGKKKEKRAQERPYRNGFEYGTHDREASALDGVHDGRCVQGPVAHRDGRRDDVERRAGTQEPMHALGAPCDRRCGGVCLVKERRRATQEQQVARVLDKGDDPVKDFARHVAEPRRRPRRYCDAVVGTRQAHLARGGLAFVCFIVHRRCLFFSKKKQLPKGRRAGSW
nr:hypothetical protein [Pandoravirus belohorizontensis]